MVGKQINKERAETDTNVSGLGKFKADYFDAAEDFLHNLLSQKTGTTKAELRYVIRNKSVLSVLPDVAM